MNARRVAKVWGSDRALTIMMSMVFTQELSLSDVPLDIFNY